MNEQEAIDRIRYRIMTAIEIAGKGSDGKVFEDLEMASEALERQIPKRPIIKDWDTARCPSCGAALSEHLGDGYYKHPTWMKRCPNEECSQRLDWGEE